MRHYLGAYLVELGGADVHRVRRRHWRERRCDPAGGLRGLDELGIVLDDAKNDGATGEAADSRRREPNADLDRADQRRTHRGPADASNCWNRRSQPTLPT